MFYYYEIPMILLHILVLTSQSRVRNGKHIRLIKQGLIQNNLSYFPAWVGQIGMSTVLCWQGRQLAVRPCLCDINIPSFRPIRNWREGDKLACVASVSVGFGSKEDEERDF